MSSQRSVCRETSSSLSFWLQTVFLRLLGRPTRRAVDAGLNSCCCYTSTLSDWSSSCGSTEDNVTHNKDNTQLLQSSLHINTSGRWQRVGRPSRSTVLHWLTLLPPWLHRATPVPGSLQTKQLGQIWFEYEGLSGDTLIRKLQNQIHRSEHCAGVCGVKWPTGYKKNQTVCTLTCTLAIILLIHVTITTVLFYNTRCRQGNCNPTWNLMSTPPSTVRCHGSALAVCQNSRVTRHKLQLFKLKRCIDLSASLHPWEKKQQPVRRRLQKHVNYRRQGIPGKYQRLWGVGVGVGDLTATYQLRLRLALSTCHPFHL